MLKIITAVVNNPLFIEIQYLSFQKYLKNSFEFIVFNDAKPFSDFTNEGDTTIREKIKEICYKYKIKCINLNNEYHKILQNPSIRTAESMNFILKYQKQFPGNYLIIDSDMFLFNYFDINKFKDYNCAIVPQFREKVQNKYIWNGLYYFDTNTNINLDLMNWNCLPGCDTGGKMETWLQYYEKNYKNKIYYIKNLGSNKWNQESISPSIHLSDEFIIFLKEDKRNENNMFYSEIYENVFFHYRAGGNWKLDGMEYHLERTKKLKNCILNNIK